MTDSARDFEEGMRAELHQIDQRVTAWRDELVQQQLTHEKMGRMFALGAVSSAIWRLQRKLQGDTE